MLKKLGVAVLAVVAGFYILSSTHLGSYARTGIQKARASMKHQVPLEFRLENARSEAAQLIPDMKKQVRQLAEKTVAVDNLRRDITETHARLDRQKDNIRAMAEQLKKGDVERISIDNRPIKADRLREKLARDLGSAKRCEEELKSKEQLLEAEEAQLDAAREQLSTIRSQKEQIEVQIAQMEAELMTVRVAQSRSKFHLDDSRLSSIKASLEEIRNELSVESKGLELEGMFGTELTAPASENKAKSRTEVIGEAEAFLGVNNHNDAKVAKQP